MRDEEPPFIDYNILMIKDLKERYEDTKKWILGELPKINWDSQKQIKSLFSETLEITLENVTIEHVQELLGRYDHDSEEFDLVNGLILYLKTKYTLNNYINCVLKHNENGRVYLRHEQGEWVLPNKRPLSGSPEIKECVTRTHIPKEKKHGSKKQSS